MKNKSLFIKYFIRYKQDGDFETPFWFGYIWAIDFSHAHEKAKYLEKKIPNIYDISVEGIYLTGTNIDICIPENNDFVNLLPWLIYFQLGEYISYEKSDPDYDLLIKYFEKIEEYEICIKLLKYKNK